MDAPRRERRHHRKSAAVAAGGGGAAAAAYGDVFGGPPRFAAPFGGPSPPPLNYAEVFGGVAANCSIPYLDLPPVVGGGGDLFACSGGAGDYGEIFGQFDFGDFAVPYEELFGAGETREEVASPSGSSRSSVKKESSQLDTEPLHQHFKEHEFSSISLPLDRQEFVMSYFKSTQARPDDIVEMSPYTGPSTDYVVGSCNFSHIPATNHVSKMDNSTMANGDKGKKSSSTFVTANVRSPESDIIVDQKQHISACTPISGNVSANENNPKFDSHATTANAKPSTDYAFMRVSDVNVQTQLKVPLPPLGQESKVLKKGESAAKGDVHLANHSCSPTSSIHATLSTNMPLTERETGAALSNTETNPSSAAAAMKEAMEYADARLRAAKELMERKGDSFKIRKKPSHHRSTRSAEIKTPVEVDTFEEKLSMKRLAKEEKKTENSTLDKHQTQKVSAVKSDNCDDSGKTVLPLEKPQQMVQPCTAPCETSSILEELGNWKSGGEFYELTGEDHKCKTDTTTGEEDYCERSKPVTKSSNGRKGRIETATDSEFGRYEKLQEINDGRDVGAEHMSQKEENAVSMETGRVSMILEASPENVADKGTHSSHFDELVTADNSKESHGDVVSTELPSMAEVSSEPEFIKDVPSSFSVTSSSGNHANDPSNLGNSGSRGNSVAGTSKEPTRSRGGLEVSCDDEMQCTSGSKKLQEPPEVAKFGDSQASQIKSLILEELEGSYVTQALPRAQSTSELEAGTYGKEKFSFVNESFLHSENGKVVDKPCETPIVEVEKAGSEVEGGPCSHSEESVPDQYAACPEESDITSYNKNLVGHEESTMPHVFEVASKLIKRELDQEIEGSLDPAEVENRTEGTDGPASSCKGGEAEENSDKTGTEEGSAHGNQEDQTASQTDANKVDAHGNITINEMGSVMRSGDEVIKDANDCPMRLTVDIKDEPFTFPEMCTGMQDLHQNAESAASLASNRSVPGVDKTEEVCKETERDLATERSTTFEEEKSGVKKMEGKDSGERISKAEQKHQQSHLDKSGSLPKSAERPIPISAEVSRKDAPGVQRPKERGSITNKEREIGKDKETSQRLEEAKEREKILEKEKENAEDIERKKLEEQERERERKKDKLAVERATREAHERAFAEAREKAEKMSFVARQRASAEAREKAQKDERASADARIKAERAAVERATAEARERAIEKARAEKAAAEARERRERYRSSSKESSKPTNLDIRPGTQFQRATSSGFGRNPDSRSKVVEAESALRHKAIIERHQRTTERVSKALAEKNMRDLMAQREQAEKHRLADFLDPEVKRWSNGKEGNLRALLSTLQYILGSDSGWQPVPLTDLITAAAVKKAYRKATLCVHPDKLQQRGATIRQKYICEKVFDLLKDAWNKFTSEER